MRFEDSKFELVPPAARILEASELTRYGAVTATCSPLLSCLHTCSCTRAGPRVQQPDSLRCHGISSKPVAKELRPVAKELRLQKPKHGRWPSQSSLVLQGAAEWRDDNGRGRQATAEWHALPGSGQRN